MGDNNDKHRMAGAPVGTRSPGQQEASVPADQTSGEARASSIRFGFQEGSALVQVHLKPGPDAVPLTLQSLREQLAEAGFGAFYSADKTLEAVVRKANNRETGTFVVAERRDAKAEWQMAEDKKALYLTLHRAWGGHPATRDSLMEALEGMGVPSRCVLNHPLDEVVAMGQAEHQLLAKAIEPEHGKPTQFVALTGDRPLTPVEDEQGRVDMHQVQDFIVVEPGTPLMRRVPATTGEPGLNLAGAELPAKPGKESPYSNDCEGTEPAGQDPDILVSTIKGHPVILKQGVRVDPVLKIKNVDLASGNIDFDGSVEVTGDVTSGFVVRATGDVMVRGMVEKADVYAGKCLTIAGGVMGEDQGQDEDGQLRLRTRVKAGHDLSAKFINLANVSAGGDLLIKEYALQSHLNAARDLLLGQPTGKGSLIGGWAKAGRALTANILGSEANVATEVVIGKTASKRKLTAQLQRELELCEHNWSKLASMLDAIAKGDTPKPPEQKLARIQSTAQALRRRRSRLQRLIERVAARQTTSAASVVQAKRQLHANVSVTIDGVRHNYPRDLGPSRLVRSGAELVNRP